MRHINYFIFQLVIVFHQQEANLSEESITEMFYSWMTNKLELRKDGILLNDGAVLRINEPEGKTRPRGGGGMSTCHLTGTYHFARKIGTNNSVNSGGF